MRRLVVLLALMLPLTLRAQHAVSVTGTVIANGAPLEGARVSASDLGLSAISNSAGRYSFIIPASKVRGQTVTLTARHRRFDARSVQVVLDGEPLIQNFELRTAPEQRAPVAAAPPRGAAPPPTAAPLPTAATVPQVAVVRRAPVSVARAASAIDGNAVAEVAGPTSVAEALAGRLAGVSIVASSAQWGSNRILVRGPKSLFSDDQPLFVVDGLPIDNASVATDAQQRGAGGFDYGSPARDLDLGDVASLAMIKGPSAVALYGSRAANGVILVTTRNGRDVNGLTIAATQQTSFETPLRLPQFQNQYGQGLGGAFEFFDGLGGGVHDGVAESWGPPLDGRPLEQFSLTDARHADVRFWQARPNNVRDFFERGRTLTTRVSAQGSGDHGSGRLSFSNQESGGVVPNSHHSRRSLGMNVTSALTPRWRVMSSAWWVNDRARNRAGTGFDGANPMASFLRLGRQVDVAALETHLLDASGNQISWNYAGQNNPYVAARLNSNADERQRVVAFGSSTFDIANWLSATGTFGTDVAKTTRDFRIAAGWMGGFPTLSGRGDFSSGGFEDQRIGTQQTNADLFLRATRRTANDLSIALTIGANRRNEDASIHAVGTDQLTQAGVYDVSNSAMPVLPIDRSSRTRSNSAYSTVSMSLRDLATLDVGARNEWSSVGSRTRSLLSPSASVSFAFTRAAPALRLGGLLDDGRLHAQWAQASDATMPLLLPLAPPSGSGAVMVRADSPLEPERTSSWEIGTSLQALSSRFSLDIAYYSEQRTNQMLVVAVAPSSGFTHALLGGGALANRGIELAANANVIQRPKGLSWDVGLTYARNTNRVQSLGDDRSSVALGTSLWGLAVEARKNEPLGALVGTGFLRDPGSNALLLRAGLPIPDTLGGPRVLGNAQPRWTGSLTSALRYRSLELSFLVDARIGGQIFSATNMWGSYAGVLGETGFRPDTGLVIEGVDVDTHAPNATHVSTEQYYHSLLPVHERWVYDATFAKLREARLSFDLAPPFPGILRGNQLRVSLIGRNLFLWAKAPNIDPETTLGPSSFQGVELGQLPSVRSIGIQVTLTP